MDPVTKEDAQTRIANLVYESIIKYVESLERDGWIRGNGHHFAQNAAAAVAVSLTDRWAFAKDQPN